MQHVRKMALVPEAIAQQLISAQREQTELVTDSPIGTLSLLDRKLKEILEDTSLPPDLKAKEYAQVLHRFSNMRDKAVGRQLAVVHEEPVNVKPTDAWLTGLANKFRNKAEMVASHVMDNPDLSWNDKAEMLYKGRRIANSNLVDLIHTAVKPGNRLPNGWLEFVHAIRDHNIPRAALANNALYRQLEEPPVDLLTTPSPATSRRSTPYTPPTRRGKRTGRYNVANWRGL